MDNTYMWPFKSRLAFYSGRGTLLFESRDRHLDLSDTLMLHWDKISRSVTFGLRIDSAKPEKWNEDKLLSIENLIRYDLNFDAYSVTISRLGRPGTLCSTEFCWRLIIRPMGSYNKGELASEQTTRAEKPSRFRKVRSDASIGSTQRILERTFGLPSGSIRLIYPSGRKARSDASVGALIKYWRKTG